MSPKSDSFLVFCYHSEAWHPLQRAGEHHPEARPGQRLLRGAELLWPRHPQTFPHRSQRATLRQWVATSPMFSKLWKLWHGVANVHVRSLPRKQSGRSYETWPRVHHRAHDMWRWVSAMKDQCPWLWIEHNCLNYRKGCRFKWSRAELLFQTKTLMSSQSSKASFW